jgi:hypothetical protein
MKPTQQKSLPLLLALLLAVPGLASAAAPVSVSTPPAKEPILVSKLVMGEAPVGMVMEQLAGWLGAPEVIIEPEALAVKTRFNLRLENATKAVAVGYMSDALMTQARIRYEELPDGVLHFTTVLSNGTVLPFDRANAQVSVLRYVNVPPELILRRMKVWSGKEIHVGAAVLAGGGSLSLQFPRQVAVRQPDGAMRLPPPPDKSTAGVFVFARAELEKQAGIILDEQPDGSYHARLATKPTPAAPSAAPAPAAPTKQP